MKKFIRMIWPYVLGILFWVCMVYAIVAIVGCSSTRIVEVERVRTDTTYLTKQVRDSVWLHDSVLIREKGDTLWVEKWHTKYVERLRVDTMMRLRTDSVPVPYPVEKLVEKDLSWWQRFRLFLGNVSLVVLLGVLGYGGWRLYRLWRIG